MLRTLLLFGDREGVVKKCFLFLENMKRLFCFDMHLKPMDPWEWYSSERWTLKKLISPQRCAWWNAKGGLSPKTKLHSEEIVLVFGRIVVPSAYHQRLVCILPSVRVYLGTVFVNLMWSRTIPGLKKLSSQFTFLYRLNKVSKWKSVCWIFLGSQRESVYVCMNISLDQLCM